MNGAGDVSVSGAAGKVEEEARLTRRTREFWNGNPCDGQAGVKRRMAFRYGKEPWLPPVLDEAAHRPSILEVGCGQGTDALYVCGRMAEGGRYVGLDLSDESLASARRSAEEMAGELKVRPEFVAGNALALQFADESFDCVTSIGVLHHTPNVDKAVAEVRRVLKKGGVAYVCLYRINSPKLLGAYAVRGLARAFDAVAGKGKALELLRRLGSDHALGTMLLECVGVPVLESYSKGRMRDIFSGFDRVEIAPVGVGFRLGGLVGFLDSKVKCLGAMWLAVARKG